MATIYDFETGVKTEPPCPESSHPFPWPPRVVNNKVRVQFDHETFHDYTFTPEQLMRTCTELALLATKLLREEK